MFSWGIEKNQWHGMGLWVFLEITKKELTILVNTTKIKVCSDYNYLSCKEKIKNKKFHTGIDDHYNKRITPSTKQVQSDVN